MKRITDINVLLFINALVLQWGACKDVSGEKPHSCSVNISVVAMKLKCIRVLICTALLVSVTLRAVAPVHKFLFIAEPNRIQPFERLMYAVAMVETMGNTNSYNEKEQAAGIFQIRQVRIDEYNRLTGHNYTFKDVFDIEVSEKIFLYFASRIGPYRFEKIAKDWNGSGPKTELYWKRVRKYL